MHRYRSAFALALALLSCAPCAIAAGPRITLEFLPGLAADGGDPEAPLVRGRDGALYGSTRVGGVNDSGTLYRVVPGARPAVSTVYSFAKDAGAPRAPMIAAADGRLYGITSQGMVLYQLSPGEHPVVKQVALTLAGNVLPDTTLVAASDGALYGTIRGDRSGAGGIYRVVPGAQPTVTQVWTFTQGACERPNRYSNHAPLNRSGFGAILGALADGLLPSAHASSTVPDTCTVDHLPLVAGRDGNLYGATRGAGRGAEEGFLYRILPGRKPKVEILFRGGGDGKPAWEPGSLIAGRDGILYGTLLAAGPRTPDTVFAIETGARPRMTMLAARVPAAFQGASLLAADASGRLYGSTAGSRYRDTSQCQGLFVFSPSPAPRVDMLMSFRSRQEKGQPGQCDAVTVGSTLVAGADGALYTTVTPPPFPEESGPARILRITTGDRPAAAFTTTFPHALGSGPVVPLYAAPDGQLYGATRAGAAHGAGGIYRYDPGAARFTPLFAFDTQKSLDVGTPPASGPDGRLYGTVGTIYQVDTGGDAKVVPVHDFHSASLSAAPEGSLFAGPDGALYGVVPRGGQHGAGSLFRVTPGKQPTAGPFFDFDSSTGSLPDNRLVTGRGGVMYGVAREGGASGNGALFQITPGAKPSVAIVYSFRESDGMPNEASLAAGADGRVYGLASRNGFPCAKLYRYTPGSAGRIETLHLFDGSACRRQRGLVGSGPYLYLVASGNGADDTGGVYQVSTGDRPEVVRLAMSGEGADFDEARLIAGTDGKIYGVTSEYKGGGRLFQVDAGARPSVRMLARFAAPLVPNFGGVVKGGYLYGTSVDGGTHNLGALLRYRPGSDKLDLLYSFSDTGDGAHPGTPLMLHSDGYLYGLTTVPSMRSNGRVSLGRLFRFRPPD